MTLNVIISKYILKQFALIFFATLFVLTAVIMLFDVIELLRTAAKKEVASFLDIGVLALLKSPQMIHLILPFVMLIAGLIFFFRMSRSSELIVMRAVGLSVWNFVMPVVLFVFIIGVLDILAFNPITALTARRYERLEEQLGMTSSNPFSWTEEGLWFREVKDDKVLVMRAARVRQEGKSVLLDNVSVIELTPLDRLVRQSEAAVGYLNQGGLTLKDAFVIDTSSETTHTLPIETFETRLSLERILEKFDEPQTMSFWRFPKFIRFLEESGFSAANHRMYWHELIAFPLFLVAMLMISAVFSLPPTSRQGKILIRVLMTVLGGFLLYFFSRITSVIGIAGGLPMFLAAWGPALVSIPLCVSALLHFEDG